MVTNIQEAREFIAAAFVKDPMFHHGYVSNVAMLLHDRYDIKDYDKRNQAAKDIIKLIFEG